MFQIIYLEQKVDTMLSELDEWPIFSLSLCILLRIAN